MIDKKNNVFHNFIINDFSQMFSEKRHTDGRYNFFITIYFTIITISVSIFAFIYNNESVIFENVIGVFACIFFVVSVYGIIIVSAMYFNRVNNIKAIRQINYIRKHYLNNPPNHLKEFTDKYIMSVDPNKPLFYKVNTTQMIFMYSISALSSILMGGSLYLVFQLNIPQEILFIVVSSFIVIILFFLQTYLISSNLKRRDKENKIDSNK